MAKDDKAGTVLAFLIGMAIGAAAGLLFAPKAGDEMRDDVQKFAETAKDQLQDAVNQGTDAFKKAQKAGG